MNLHTNVFQNALCLSKKLFWGYVENSLSMYMFAYRGKIAYTRISTHPATTGLILGVVVVFTLSLTLVSASELRNFSSSIC